MPCASQNYLIKLCTTARKFGTILNSNSLSSLATTNVQSKPFQSDSSSTSFTISSHFYKYSRCYIHSDSQQEQQAGKSTEGHDQSHSQSSQQRYHREQYERKRSSREHDHRWKSDDHSSGFQMDLYQRLNVQPNADLKDIKSAYYSLSKKFHPDVVGTSDPNAIENFRLITEAYDTLSDPKLRAEYDKQLELDTSSRPHPFRYQKQPNRDYDFVFKTRNADMIFKFRQDAALLREKERNPLKFRAGKFDNSTTGFKSGSQSETISRLGERLKHIESASRDDSRNKKDGSEFYRMHLYHIIRRRHSDMISQHGHRVSYSSPPNSQADVSTIVVNLSMIVGVLLLVIVMYISQDVGSHIDSKLEKKQENSKSSS